MGKLPDAPGLADSVGFGSFVGPPVAAGSVGPGAVLAGGSTVADGAPLAEGDADEPVGEAGDGPAGPHAEMSRARMPVSASTVPAGDKRRGTESGIPGRALLTPRD
jgi:hypothetical protein